MTRFLVLLLLLVFSAVPARAESFVKATAPHLLNTLIRFGSINIYFDDFIDEYLMVSECKLYTNFFQDDFKWQKIRDAVRQKIKQEVQTYPTGYGFDTQIQLGRYDFENRLYRFSDRTLVRNVNAFTVFEAATLSCGGRDLKRVPNRFRIILDHPVYIEGFPFGEADAKALMQRLDVAENKEHVVYARFNLRVTYVSSFAHQPGIEQYVQPSESQATTAARLDGRLDSVDFYEDEAHTKLIYTYRPGAL